MSERGASSARAPLDQGSDAMYGNPSDSGSYSHSGRRMTFLQLRMQRRPLERSLQQFHRRSSSSPGRLIAVSTMARVRLWFSKNPDRMANARRLTHSCARPESCERRGLPTEEARSALSARVPSRPTTAEHNPVKLTQLVCLQPDPAFPGRSQSGSQLDNVKIFDSARRALVGRQQLRVQSDSPSFNLLGELRPRRWVPA